MNQIDLVATGMSRISILVSLPPDKPGNLEALILVLGKVSRKIIEYCMSFSDEIVVLLAGVPVDFFTRVLLGP